jgi:hypothetical protein
MSYEPHTKGLQKNFERSWKLPSSNMPDIFYTLGTGQQKSKFLLHFVIAFQPQFAISRDIVLLIIYIRYSDLALYGHRFKLASLLNETQQTYITTIAYCTFATTNAFCRFCCVSAEVVWTSGSHHGRFLLYLSFTKWKLCR